MKRNKAKYMSRGLIISRFMFFLFFLLPVQKGFAQDESAPEQETVEKIKPVLKIQANKKEDDSRNLIAVFSYKDKETKSFYNVKGIPLNFYTGSDSLIKIGSFLTDENGKAICDIKPDFKLPKNEEGFIHFYIEFEGNDIFKPMDNELDVIDLDLKINLEVIDSVKTLIVKAEKILANDERIPLTEVEIPVFVQRMFSALKVGDVYLEEGEGTFEFPNDIPGDTLGIVTVIVKYDEHEEFANVRKSQSIDWGVVTSHHTIYHPRSLWTQVAPVWMIVTLSIMLLGVWGHYFYVIFQMIKLKKGQKEV